MSDEIDAAANRLDESRSPYLLQHASNPVYWMEWGDEAFERSRQREVPIFLSVGYSTCHWCHVMAHESFENSAIAEILNFHFVSIKVDREERPDVDRIYMAFVQSLTGRGGWPMSVWLTPDLAPFYGGTYFPPENRYQQVGFSDLLLRIAKLWREQRPELLEQSSKYLGTLRESEFEPKEASSAGPGLASVHLCVDQLLKEFDEEEGGFGSAPKFPMPSYLTFLMEARRVVDPTVRPAVDRAVQTTLARMAAGGICDQVGRGFHRYSVDRYWHVPHFEKMLYDQGQLAGVYAQASALFERSDFEATAAGIAEYVSGNLSSPEGGFYSAEDADSPLPNHTDESGEGAFYTWTEVELREALGSEAYPIFKLAYGVEPEGNARSESDPHGELKGLNTLYCAADDKAVGEALSLSENAVRSSLQSAVAILRERRAHRPRPHLDDKVLASWNGLMISGLCVLFQANGDERALDAVQRAARFVFEKMYEPSGCTLYRTFRKRRGEVEAFAEDYAIMTLACIDLYESTFDPDWLRRAEELIKTLIARFWDSLRGGFFASSSTDKALIARMKDDYDGAEPSANSMAALALLRLGSLLDEEAYHLRARDTIRASRNQWEGAPRAMPLMLVALLRSLLPAQQIVIAGDLDSTATKALAEVARRHRQPNSVLLGVSPSSDWLVKRSPRFGDFVARDQSPLAYVCDNYTCKEPTASSDGLAALLTRAGG